MIAKLIELADAASERIWRWRHPGERYGDWMPTASGGVFWPLDPRPEEVQVTDIAHALAQVPRFAGHLAQHYSVAQHSVLCAQAAMSLAPHQAHRPGVAGLIALLHDGSEAYLGDLIRPLKRLPAFAPYRRYERRLQAVIYQSQNLFPAIFPTSFEFVREIDNRVLASEVHALFPGYKLNFERRWETLARPLDIVVEPWAIPLAEQAFITLYLDLISRPFHMNRNPDAAATR